MITFQVEFQILEVQVNERLCCDNRDSIDMK